jgi:hypothetical protein
MKKINVTINASHPIHQLIDDLNLSVVHWLIGVRSPEVPKMLRAIGRAMGAIRIAGTGRRQEHHVGSAVEALIWVETGFRLLFQGNRISAEIFDLARRHLDRVLKAIELLAATDSESWSTVEMPPLQKRPDNLAEDPSIKSILLLRSRIAEETRALRPLDQQPAPDPKASSKKAA